MKIGIYASGCPANAPLAFSTRGEGRWGLNWAHILNRHGHQAEILYDTQTPNSPGFDFDLYMAGSYAPHLCEPSIPHVHLFYGVPHEGTLRQINCYNAGRCVLGFGYYHDYALYATYENPGYLGVPLPIPFSESMLPSPLVPAAERRGITWASKEIWHPGLAERSPYVPRVGIHFLEALADLNERTDFVFNLVQPKEEGSSFSLAPPAAQAALSRLKNVLHVQTPTFLDILQVMSRSKLSLGVSGAMSSTIDALFCKAVPVLHNTTVFANKVESDGGCLSNAFHIEKDEIYHLLERFWFDEEFYNRISDKFQAEIAPHREENAMVLFQEALKKMGLER